MLGIDGTARYKLFRRKPFCQLPEAWKMVTLARALGMKVMVGCMTETSCAISAASQFSPAVDFADLDGSLLIANDRFKGMEVVKGKITLPDLPGIGVVKI